MHRGAVRASLPAPPAAARFPTPPPQDRRSRGRPRGDSAARLSRPPVVRPFRPRPGRIPPARPRRFAASPAIPQPRSRPAFRRRASSGPGKHGPRAFDPPTPETARLSCGGFPCFTLSPCRVPIRGGAFPGVCAPWDCDGKRRVPARRSAFPDAPLSGTNGSGPSERSKPPGCPASVAAPPPAVAHFPTPPPQDRRPRGRPRGAAPPGRFSLRPFAHSPTPRPHPPGAASPSRRFARYPSGR